MSFVDAAPQIIEDAIDDTLATYLRTDDWARISPIEFGSVLAARAVPEHSLLVPREGVAARPLVAGYAEDGSLHLLSEKDDGLADGWSAMAWVQLPPGAAAVYSAVEGSLFIVGGNEEWNQGMIRRYDVGSGYLHAWAPLRAPSQDVRGITFHPGRRELYVLEVDGDTARIVAHPTDGRDSQLLWEGAFTSTDAHLGLGLASDGSLVLVRSDAEKFTAWRVNSQKASSSCTTPTRVRAG